VLKKLNDLKNEEYSLLNQQRLYLQMLTDIVVEDSDNHALRRNFTALSHECQGKICSRTQVWTGLTRKCNELCYLKANCLPFLKFIDQLTGKINIRLQENMESRTEFSSLLFHYSTRYESQEMFKSAPSDLDEVSRFLKVKYPSSTFEKDSNEDSEDIEQYFASRTSQSRKYLQAQWISLK
jgi:hypothetical protein